MHGIAGIQRQVELGIADGPAGIHTDLLLGGRPRQDDIAPICVLREAARGINGPRTVKSPRYTIELGTRTSPPTETNEAIRSMVTVSLR